MPFRVIARNDVGYGCVHNFVIFGEYGILSYREKDCSGQHTVNEWNKND